MYPSWVRFLLRPVGLLLTLVLLQLVLLESGYACRVEAGTAPAETMAGMDMPGAPATHSPKEQRGGQPDGPCRFPWAPNGCQAMAPCAPAILLVARATDVSAMRTTPVSWTLELLVPPSVSRAPELPPPRTTSA